jgi:hypothetical protein
VVAHTCNPSYSDPTDPRSKFEASPGKKCDRLHFNQQKLGIVAAHYQGSINRRIFIQDSPGINTNPYLKNNQSKDYRVTQVVE